MTGKSQDRRRRAAPVAAAALVLALVVLLVLPLTSLGSSQPNLGATLGSVLKNVSASVQTAVQKLTTPQAKSGTVAKSTAPASKPAASSTGYTPPAYSSNPHGQGGVASVSVNPSSTRPYTYAPGGSSGQGEALVIGRGRSEQQSNGTYDAHTTIAALLGTELLGVNANQGESNTGPLNSVQQAVLNNICSSLSQLICLTVLAADTSATSNGATTHFQTVGLTSKQILGLGVNAASSDSSISTSGNCQTASGASQVAGVSTSTAGISTPLASAATSHESSTACSGQAPTQTGSSSVVNLGSTGLPLPAPGCANGTINTPGLIPTLLPSICNADDMTQISAPFGVREALTLLGVQTGATSLLRAATAASESHAVAPPTTPPNTCTDKDTDCGKGETCVNGKDPDGDGDCTGGTGPGGNKKCTDADKDCGIGPNGQPETCVGGKDPDGDGDCTSGTNPGGNKHCSDADHDCGIGPNGQPEVCVNGADPDGDGDCTACTDGDHDCGIGPNGAAEVCVAGADPDGDGDCVSQVTALAAKTTLPFTGENVLEVILVGLILTGGGLALANRTRTRRPDGAGK
jgi:hypothetical protein